MEKVIFIVQEISTDIDCNQTAGNVKAFFTREDAEACAAELGMSERAQTWGLRYEITELTIQ